MTLAAQLLVATCAAAIAAAPVLADAAPPLAVVVTVDTTTPLVTLPRGYLGFTLDWWPPTQEDFGTSTVNLIDLTHPRLVGLARALGPATLRVGGSLDNVVKYLVGNMTRAACEAPVPFRGSLFPNLCFNLTRWTQVLAFVGSGGGLAPGSRLIFGLQLDLGSARFPAWKSSNMLDFLRATATLPGAAALEAVEVGEETNPQPGSPAFAALTDAYRGVRAAVGALWPADARPLVLGPCAGMNENVPPFAWGLEFVAATRGSIDAYVMHSYNNDGGNSWRVPGFLNQTAVQAAGLRGALDAAAAAAHTPALPLFCGECGPHNGGGIPNVTNRAISSFWYTDALHALPRLGVTRFNRQTLAGGSYSLLSNDDFLPRPDYFAALAFSKLAGARVLNTSAQAADGSDVSVSLRTYASCAPQGHGAVTVAFINVNAAASFSLSLGSAVGRKTTYAFAPVGGDPLATALALNGVTLAVNGNEPPPLVGVDGDADVAVTVAPQTFGYVVYHDAAAPACA